MKKEDFQISNENDSIIVHEKDHIPFLTFRKLEKAGIKHGFSTRLGGVSEGYLSSMNLSFSRGDEPERVVENFKRIGQAIGFSISQLVFSDQQHQTTIRKVTKEDMGKGIIKELDYACVDGLMTNEKGLVLATFYADCVPLFFYDPVKEVIALSHSGWRGTAGRIGARTIEKMCAEYGCQKQDIIAAIGPSICKNCYEVSEDVYQAFQTSFSADEMKQIFAGKPQHKYQLDLWKANEIILKTAGITKDHLDITDLCTCCNPKLLFSHRASNGKRGNLAAFMVL